MRNWLRFIRKLPQHPEKVLLICAICVVLSLLADGTALKIFQLSQRQSELEAQIAQAKSENEELKQKIETAHDPKYLEREARERFDLVYKDDLIFVFAE